MRRHWVPLFMLLLLFAPLAACQSNGSSQMFDRALRLWQERHYDEAAQNFIALTTAYPDDELVDDALFWIANLYEHYLHEPEQALRYYRSLTKRSEEAEYYLPAMKGLARVYESQGEEGRSKALLIYQKLQQKQLSPNRFVENQTLLAQLYIRAGQFEKARVELKRILQAKPDSRSDIIPKTYHLIGLSYYMEGRKDLAEVTFAEIDQKYQQGKATLASAMSLAQLYEEQDQLQSAITIYKSILSRLEQRDVFYQMANDRIQKLKSRHRQTKS